jgi:hypothetical protein
MFGIDLSYLSTNFDGKLIKIKNKFFFQFSAKIALFFLKYGLNILDKQQPIRG